MDLFAATRASHDHTPLAERLRPRDWAEVIGQQHLLESGAPLAAMLESGRLHSMIFWGPPGSGKTTFARILAEHSGLALQLVSAVTTGAAQLRTIGEESRLHLPSRGTTLLFIDEIHRLNKAQQDVLLPYMEDGSVILIGATTENPSFELNAALLSRSQVLVLNPLTPDALEQLLQRAEEQEEKPLPLTPEARAQLIEWADGDARYLLGMCEQLWRQKAANPLDVDAASRLLQRRAPRYDKGAESHYNLISALHKSLRGSDTDAALYWLHRMLQAGEDPHYILRRLVRFASEDIGLADPQALPQVQAAWLAYDQLGSPEGELAITQAVIYLGTAPKSNAAYKAHKKAASAARQHGSLNPPMYAMNAPTKLMKEQGYADGYEYDHDTPEGCAGLNYFPPDLPRTAYYRPVERGFERDIAKRLHYWDGIRQRRQKQEEDV